MTNDITLETVHLKSPDGFRPVQVCAVRTDVPQLVITPGIRVAKDGTVTLEAGYLQLTHAPTGRSAANGSSVERLRGLASKLAPFQWDFTDPMRFRDGHAHVDERDRILAVIRDWEMAEDSGGPIAFSGDSDEMIEARKSAPAETLLREHMDGFFTNERHRLENIKWDADNKSLFMASVAYSCEAYGVIYLLAVLRSIDPAVADAAARDLVGAWECGEFGELVYQWGEELTAGKALTLHGIPSANPLRDFGGPAAESKG